MNCSRKLYIPTPSIFVDTAYPKSVVCLAWNACHQESPLRLQSLWSNIAATPVSQPLASQLYTLKVDSSESLVLETRKGELHLLALCLSVPQ